MQTGHMRKIKKHFGIYFEALRKLFSSLLCNCFLYNFLIIADCFGSLMVYKLYIIIRAISRRLMMFVAEKTIRDCGNFL